MKLRRLIVVQAALALLVAALVTQVAQAKLIIPVGNARADVTRVAGPSYTPAELEALKTYSNASFAQKQAILAGDGTVASTAVAADNGFDWRDASLGALGTLGIVAAGMLLAGEHRRQRPAVL